MRDRVGSSVGPTASVSMLNPRRANRPAIRVSTPGLFSTRIERMCLRPVRTPADASSSSSVSGSLVPGSPILVTPPLLRVRSRVPSSPSTPSWSPHHLAGGRAGRDHRVRVLLAGDADVDDDRPLDLQRLLDV